MVESKNSITNTMKFREGIDGKYLRNAYTSKIEFITYTFNTLQYGRLFFFQSLRCLVVLVTVYYTLNFNPLDEAWCTFVLKVFKHVLKQRQPM